MKSRQKKEKKTNKCFKKSVWLKGTKEDIHLSSFQVFPPNSWHFSQISGTSLFKGVSCFSLFSFKSTTQRVFPVSLFEHLRRLRRTDSWGSDGWGRGGVGGVMREHLRPPPLPSCDATPATRGLKTAFWTRLKGPTDKRAICYHTSAANAPPPARERPRCSRRRRQLKKK